MGTRLFCEVVDLYSLGVAVLGHYIDIRSIKEVGVHVSRSTLTRKNGQFG